MIATWIPYLRWWNTKPFFWWNYIPWYPPKLVCLSTVCPNTIWKSNTVMDNNDQSTTILRSKKTWGSIAKRNKLPESSQPQTLYSYFSMFFSKKCLNKNKWKLKPGNMEKTQSSASWKHVFCLGTTKTTLQESNVAIQNPRWRWKFKWKNNEHQLVGGAITIWKNMSSSMGREGWHHIYEMEKWKNVPNHQAVNHNWVDFPMPHLPDGNPKKIINHSYYITT